MKIQKLASMLASTSIAFSAFADNHEGTDHLSPFNVIGTKADVSALQGSGTVLDSSDLKTFKYTDIHDILRQVPGVYVRPEEGYGFFPNISIRGNDPGRSGKITILEDGVPSSPSPFADAAAYYSPTAGRMAGFEILKGSSQLKYGPNTTGGVLNYLSTPIPDADKSYLRISYGENSEIISHAYSGGKVDFAGGKLGYLLEVFDHRSDGWKSLNLAPLGMPNRDMPIAKTDMNFKLGYEFGSQYLEFKYGNTFMDSDVSYQGQDDKAAYTANPYLVPFTANWDNMDSHQHRYYLRHIAELSDSMSLTSTLFHNEFNRNWYKMNGTTAVGTLYAPTGDFTWDNKNNNRNYKTTGFQTNLDFEVGSNDFDLGFRIMSEDYIQNPYTQDTYSYTLATQSVSQVVKASKSKLAGVDPYKHSDSTEFYLTDTVSFGALTFTPGVRYTDVDYQNASTKGSVDDVLIGIGSNYELSDTLSVFAGIHEGHAMPGAGAVNKTTGLIEKEIEESLAFEIGARGMFGKIGYEVAYFNTKFENLLAGANTGLGIADTYNVGDASIQGLEVSLATDFGSDQGFGIPVSLSATFSDSEFDSLKPDTAGGGFTGDGIYEGAVVGNSFAYVPDMQLNLRGGLVFDKASTYLNYRYQDEVYTTGANTDKIGAQGILDWSGFYDIKKGVNVFAKVSNLTDEQYTHSTLPRGYRPGAPRLWSLGMEFDF